MQEDKRIPTRNVVIETKAGKIVAPAIDYDAPFPYSEFEKAPVVTEEEVIAYALSAGCPPAGWDIIQKKRKRERMLEMQKEQMEKDKALRDNKGNRKNLTLKQLKLLELEAKRE